MPTVAEPPRDTVDTVKHKSFTYQNNVRWLGTRAAILSGDGKPHLRLASPPEFKGEANVWTPEDLFVAAVNMCTLTTFASFAQRLGLPIDEYTSEAEGTLEFSEGRYRFTKIVLRPTIVVADGAALNRTALVLEDAHRACLVANSITAEVVIEPDIQLSGVE